MKKILLLLTILFSFFPSTFAAWNIFWTQTTEIIYCQWSTCTLDNWTKAVKTWLTWIEKNRTATEYILDLVRYLITFVSLIAVLYIIYAWFRVLTWWWNEEAVKKAKWTIVWVLIWIVIIWLAYSIVYWIVQVVTSS